MSYEIPSGFKTLLPTQVDVKLTVYSLGDIRYSPLYKVGFSPIYEETSKKRFMIVGGTAIDGWDFKELDSKYNNTVEVGLYDSVTESKTGATNQRELNIENLEFRNTYKDSLTKADVGLSNVDNTADINKPVSNAQQSAIDVISDDLSTHTSAINPHNITKATVGLQNVPNVDTTNASNITSGILPSSVLPPVALTSVFTATSEAEMLGLQTQEGDIVVRTDEGKTYVRSSGLTGTMSDFIELVTPTGIQVTSVNGKTGAVVLTTNDVSEGLNLYYTDTRVANNAAVQANTAKVGITPTQTANILTNNDKISAFGDELRPNDIGVTVQGYDSNTTKQGVISLTSLGFTGDTNANYYQHPVQSIQTITASGANVIGSLSINGLGHVTGDSVRRMYLSDLGYTGDTNANHYVLPFTDNSTDWDKVSQYILTSKEDILDPNNLVYDLFRYSDSITGYGKGSIVTFCNIDVLKNSGVSMPVVQLMATESLSKFYIRTDNLSSKSNLTATWNELWHSNNANKDNVDWKSRMMYLGDGVQQAVLQVKHLGGSYGAALSVAPDNKITIGASSVTSGVELFHGLTKVARTLGAGFQVFGTAYIEGDIKSRRFYSASDNVGDLNNLPSYDRGLQVLRYSSGAANKPVTSNNANALLNIMSHNGGYGKQLAFGDSDDLYIRRVTAGTYASWHKLYHDGNANTAESFWRAKFMRVQDQIVVRGAIVDDRLQLWGAYPYMSFWNEATDHRDGYIQSHSGNLLIDVAGKYDGIHFRVGGTNQAYVSNAGLNLPDGNVLQAYEKTAASWGRYDARYTATVGALDVRLSTDSGASWIWTVRDYQNKFKAGFQALISGDTSRLYFTPKGSRNFSMIEGDSIGMSFYLADGGDSQGKVLAIDQDGTCTATEFIATSDARLKDNIVTITDALTKVNNLRGVSYQRTDIADERTHIGLIAQEVEKVLPELVKENKDGFKSVNYAQITAVLIEAVKELTNKLEVISR